MQELSKKKAKKLHIPFCTEKYCPKLHETLSECRYTLLQHSHKFSGQSDKWLGSNDKNRDFSLYFPAKKRVSIFIM